MNMTSDTFMDLPYNQENNEDLIEKWSRKEKKNKKSLKAKPKLIDKVQKTPFLGPNWPKQFFLWENEDIYHLADCYCKSL